MYDYELLTPNTVIAILRDLGFDTTKASIARYMQDGLVMRPLQKNTRKGNEERAYYHPLAIIEIMTAILLFRGDFLTYKSEARIARLTDRDIFFGRLKYYLKHYPENSEINLYFTTIDNYPADFFKDSKKLYMNLDSISKYFDYYNSKFDLELNVLPMMCFSYSYKNFSFYTYTETYNYLLNQHKDKIFNINYIAHQHSKV